MATGVYREITHNGIWKQNPGLVQILGLCPILAVSTSFVNAVSLGLATIGVMAISNLAVAALRSFIPYQIRIPIFILIIAALVTVVDMLFNAFLHPLYLVLGIFIPLIVTNCIVLARVEAFAAKNSIWAATVDGIAMGVGLVVVLGVLGGMRELVGAGTLFSGIDMIIPGTHSLQLMPEDYPGFLLAVLPPGAFMFLGCMIAAKNWLDAGAEKRARQRPPSAAPSLPAQA